MPEQNEMYLGAAHVTFIEEDKQYFYIRPSRNKLMVSLYDKVKTLMEEKGYDCRIYLPDMNIDAIIRSGNVNDYQYPFVPKYQSTPSMYNYSIVKLETEDPKVFCRVDELDTIERSAPENPYDGGRFLSNEDIDWDPGMDKFSSGRDAVVRKMISINTIVENDVSSDEIKRVLKDGLDNNGSRRLHNFMCVRDVSGCFDIRSRV